MKDFSAIRVFVMDVVDFLIIATFSILFCTLVYALGPNMVPVEFSIYFMEQFVEVFFLNPILLLCLISFVLAITLIYFPLCFINFNTSLGGLLANLVIAKSCGKKAPVFAVFLRSVLGILGVLFGMISPFYAWWIESDHRGLGDYLAGTRLVLKSDDASSH